MPSPHLHRKLQETLGDDAGKELAAVVDRIDPIRGDIAELRHEVRAEIAELRHEIAGLRDEVRAEISGVRHEVRSELAGFRNEFRADFAALRADMAQMNASVDARIEKSAKEQTRFMFLAWAVLLSAVIGLYTR